MHEDIKTSDQGIYAAVVRKGNHASTYVGSSYGNLGIENRVLNGHMNPTYRDTQPEKALYVAMKEPGATTSFVCLLRYRKKTSTGQVLLAEAVCAALFGTFGSRMYREIRLCELPIMEWNRVSTGVTP